LACVRLGQDNTWTIAISAWEVKQYRLYQSCVGFSLSNWVRFSANYMDKYDPSVAYTLYNYENKVIHRTGYGVHNNRQQ
jgi:hypothetical protein